MASDKTLAISGFLDALDDMLEAGWNLLQAWEGIEANGLEVTWDGPIPNVAEMVARLEEFQAAVYVKPSGQA